MFSSGISTIVKKWIIIARATVNQSDWVNSDWTIPQHTDISAHNRFTWKLWERFHFTVDFQTIFRYFFSNVSFFTTEIGIFKSKEFYFITSIRIDGTIEVVSSCHLTFRANKHLFCFFLSFSYRLAKICKNKYIESESFYNYIQFGDEKLHFFSENNWKLSYNCWYSLWKPIQSENQCKLSIATNPPGVSTSIVNHN